MNTTTETDNLAHAKENVRGWLQSIEEMVARLNEDDDDQDAARQEIDESPLSVEVRQGWYVPGGTQGSEQEKPVEYCILLTTGGPALRIVGELNRFCEPETAQLQIQEWGTPWTNYHSGRADQEEMLLAYARCFWFGE